SPPSPHVRRPRRPAGSRASAEPTTSAAPRRRARPSSASSSGSSPSWPPSARQRPRPPRAERLPQRRLLARRNTRSLLQRSEEILLVPLACLHRAAPSSGGTPERPRGARGVQRVRGRRGSGGLLLDPRDLDLA